MNTGVRLWNRAKQIIPGGNQLLSKRSDRFLPDQWPSYYKKAKGVEVWDLDDNHYIDMSIMGIGACTLGYADKDVSAATIEAIRKGSMCTLNCYEEVELAELLLKIEPWADMLRFSRTGGEACAMASRIARAATGRDKIAFCGYHGWGDWYLAANLADDKNLDGHLLPGLSPKGVPRALKGSAIPFNYNDSEAIRKICDTVGSELAAIMMEPVRSYSPDNKFLKEVRELADKTGAALIFDEVTSGWRLNWGGAHKLYAVDPDILIFAKAMGNGHPISAVLGTREVMEAVQGTFISSTYWTERVGFTAALATIKKMKRVKSAQHMIKIGERISDGWKECAKSNDLKIHTVGIPPLTTCVFDYKGTVPLELQTLFTQEMLNRGYLGWTHVYTAYKHTNEIVDRYIEEVDEIFKIMKKGLEKNNIKRMLKGPIATTGFARLA